MSIVQNLEDVRRLQVDIVDTINGWDREITVAVLAYEIDPHFYKIGDDYNWKQWKSEVRNAANLLFRKGVLTRRDFNFKYYYGKGEKWSDPV